MPKQRYLCLKNENILILLPCLKSILVAFAGLGVCLDTVETFKLAPTAFNNLASTILCLLISWFCPPSSFPLLSVSGMIQVALCFCYQSHSLHLECSSLSASSHSAAKLSLNHPFWELFTWHWFWCLSSVSREILSISLSEDLSHHARNIDLIVQ